MTQIVAILLGVMLWLSLATTGIAQETIRLASGEWAPYQSEHLKNNGLASRIVPQAFALEAINVERVSTDELNFKKLLKRRIHIFPNERESGYAMLRKLFTQN